MLCHTVVPVGHCVVLFAIPKPPEGPGFKGICLHLSVIRVVSNKDLCKLRAE